MGNTEIVAWWGAILASLVLGWDIIKWFQSGPKLKKRISLNIRYDDSKVIKKEKHENGESVFYEEYCHIELVNVGTLPTTIMGITAKHKKHKKQKQGLQKSVMQQVFTEHFGKKFPHVISSGEVWSCRLPMNFYETLLDCGRPEIHVSVSHLDKPIVIRATKKANKAISKAISFS
ncbi:MAG: hypothetical protein HRT52_20265 [Colwellia sp.]|nr:hypothetical protein [Colwellia sp.]